MRLRAEAVFAMSFLSAQEFYEMPFRQVERVTMNTVLCVGRNTVTRTADLEGWFYAALVRESSNLIRV